MSNPIIVNSGQIVGSSGGSWNYVNALLINESNNLTAITFGTDTYNDFIVPFGKKLIILNNYSSHYDKFAIDNMPISQYINHASFSLGNPIIANSGQTITTIGGSWSYSNGYLVDENYFANCGGGSSSSSTSTLDSTTIANMIAAGNSG